MYLKFLEVVVAVCLMIHKGLKKLRHIYTNGTICYKHILLSVFIMSSAYSNTSSVGGDWNTVVRPASRPQHIEFPTTAAAAFGKKKIVGQARFSDTAVNAFSRSTSVAAPSRIGFPETASAAFGSGSPKSQQGFSDNATSAFGSGPSSPKPPHGFPDNATSAFGSEGQKRSSGGDAFGTQASSAFSRKRNNNQSSASSPSPLVSRRNDSFGALLAAAMPEIEAKPSNDYSKSALRYTKPDSSPKIESTDMFPALASVSTSTLVNPKVSFADVIRKRAQEDEEEAKKKAEEAERARQNKEKEALENNRIRPSMFIAKRTPNKYMPDTEEEEYDVNSTSTDIHDLDYVSPSRRKYKSNISDTAHYDDQDDAEDDVDNDTNY